MVNRHFEIVPVVTMALGMLMLFCGDVAAGQTAGPKNVCSLVHPRSGAHSASSAKVTLSGNLNKTYHLGIIATDKSCSDKFIRIVIPVPDGKNISAQFQEFSKSYGSVGTHFSCTCSGRLKFTKGIPILTLDNALVLKQVDPQ